MSLKRRKKKRIRTRRELRVTFHKVKDLKKIATHADFFIEGMSQSFMEINCK